MSTPCNAYYKLKPYLWWMNSIQQMRCVTAACLLTCLPALTGCQLAFDQRPSLQLTTPQQSKYGTYANPPLIGKTIPAQVGSVLCFSKGGALAMAQTGFFAPDCEGYTEAPALIVQAREHQQLQEGGVWLLKAFYQQQPVWLPIPWHDWA